MVQRLNLKTFRKSALHFNEIKIYHTPDLYIPLEVEQTGIGKFIEKN
jgi:hypothetical protein